MGDQLSHARQQRDGWRYRAEQAEAQVVQLKADVKEAKKSAGLSRLIANDKRNEVVRLQAENKRVRALADGWSKAYSTDFFPEPEPGEHGKTVDACSARMGRWMADVLQRTIDGDWDERSRLGEQP